MTTRQTVVVLGAGPAGLAAAIRLSQAGYAVTLLEERDRLGGAMVAQSPDGDLLDALPPSYLDTRPRHSVCSESSAQRA